MAEFSSALTEKEGGGMWHYEVHAVIAVAWHWFQGHNALAASSYFKTSALPQKSY